MFLHLRLLFSFSDFRFFLQRSFLSFADAAQLDPILKKIEEFSSALSQAAETKVT